MSFVAFLSNVNSSILPMKIQGFRTRPFLRDLGIHLISVLENIGPEAAYERAVWECSCLNSSEDKFFVLMKSYAGASPPATEASSKNDFLEETLADSIRLFKTLEIARLYKGGDIRAPLVYSFKEVDGKLVRILKSLTIKTYVSQDPFRLEKTEVGVFNEFLKSCRDPETNSLVKRPFKCFRDSYATKSRELAFTSLMTGMEALFHKRGVRYIGAEMARNCATLIGANPEEVSTIESKLRVLYTKRSLVIHEGEEAVGDEEGSTLRDYLRRSIRKILESDLNAKQVRLYVPPQHSMSCRQKTS